MPKFFFRAATDDGGSVQSQIEAVDLTAAVTALEAEGLVVNSIRPAVEGDPSEDRAPVQEPKPEKPRESQRDSMGFIRKFVSPASLDRCQALAPALSAYAKELPTGRSRQELSYIADEFAANTDPLNVLSSPRLRESWLPLVAAVGGSGDLRDLLNRFVQESDRRRSGWYQFAAAVSYPIGILLVAGVILYVLATQVVPEFREMFLSFDTQLPAATRLVFWIASLLETPWLLLLLLLMALAFVLVARRTFDVWRPNGRLVTWARFTQSLADLVEIGLPAADALRVAGRVSANKRVIRASGYAARAYEGEELDVAWLVGNTLPRTALQILEDPGPKVSKAKTLRALCAMYDRQYRSSRAWFMGIIEPVTLILVSLIIGVVVITLFMPLVSLITGLMS